jgi:hypothetical protein
MSKTKSLISVGLVWLFTAASVCGGYKVYDVGDYGARADGKVLCTRSIQRAIDECAGDGGGTVYFPPGIFLSGNDLNGVSKVVERAPDVLQTALSEMANRKAKNE